MTQDSLPLDICQRLLAEGQIHITSAWIVPSKPCPGYSNCSGTRCMSVQHAAVFVWSQTRGIYVQYEGSLSPFWCVADIELQLLSRRTEAMQLSAVQHMDFSKNTCEGFPGAVSREINLSKLLLSAGKALCSPRTGCYLCAYGFPGCA